MSNALVQINSISGAKTPRIIWGPHPEHSSNINYKLHKYMYTGAPPTNWGSSNQSNSVFEWSWDDLLLGGKDLKFKVSANRENPYLFQETNVIDTGWSAFFKEGIALNNKKEYSLSQNYPNPFNPTTIINFSLKNKDIVELRIYDILGREIRTLLNQEMDPGEHKVTFAAGNLPSGIYFYNIKAGNYTQTHKMILMK